MEKEKVEIKDKRTTKDLQSLSRTVLPLAKQLLGKRGFVEVDIITNWTKIAGEELAQFSHPQSISFKRDEKNNGILNLMVPTGAFALEIKHRENSIISRINTYFGYNAVSGIKIIQNNDVTISNLSQQKENYPKKMLVTPEEENYIKGQVNDIKNPKLKEILIKLGEGIISSNKTEK